MSIAPGITNATFTSKDWTHFKYPLSLSPIPQFMKPGIIALCFFSLLSCIATLSLLSFLIYLFISGRHDRKAPLHKNQYLLLIFSLVLADFQCDLGFFLDIMWMHKNQIVAPSTGCFIQGWLVNIGDLGSGFFVFAISVHTFYNVVFGRRVGLNVLRVCIVALWMLATLLTAIPVILHPKDIFVTQGNWCSINGKYDVLRLYFHYIWVLAAEGIVVVLYATTFIVLRKRMRNAVPQLQQASANTNGQGKKNRNGSQSKISRATTYMILYPLIYVLSTLPLAAGRISSMVGRTPTKQYLVAGGTLMACGGWMNCLLYSFTRRIFLTERSNNGTDRSIHRSAYGGGKNSVLRSTDGGIELGQPASQYRELPSPVASTDNIVKTGMESDQDSKDGVVMQTTWEVQVEEVKESHKPERSEDGAKMGHRTFVTF